MTRLLTVQQPRRAACEKQGHYEEADGSVGLAMHVLDESACPRQTYACLDPAALPVWQATPLEVVVWR